MATVRVRLNKRGMTELLSSPEVVADLLERGDRVVDRARGLAPVNTGAYRDGLAASQEQHPSRAVVHVGSDVPYASLVEATHRTLGRSIDAAGD
jgi:hypothetical protein